MYFNIIGENKILAKISEFTVAQITDIKLEKKNMVPCSTHVVSLKQKFYIP